MTYKFYNNEIEPFQLQDGQITSISIGQYFDIGRKHWITDIIFNGHKFNNEPWNYTITIILSEYKEFYIDSVVVFLEYNKDKILNSTIFAFKTQMNTRDISNSSKLVKLFTTKNPKIK